MSKRDFLWAEKYRPQTIEECVLPDRFKNQLQGFVSQGEIPHVLMTGGAGVGKTTSARALCNEIEADVLFINASENGNIDTLRTDIRRFASAGSLRKKRKVIILDEADHLTNATQHALRGFMEEFAHNARFILTANFPNRIIDPLHSRCTEMNFDLRKDEKMDQAKAFLMRVLNILDLEGTHYDRHAVAGIVKRYFPDYRRTLNALQAAGANGIIDAGDVKSLEAENNIEDVVQLMRDGEHGKMRKWVAEFGNDFPRVITYLFNHIDDFVKPESIPNAIEYIGEANKTYANVVDTQIHLTALLNALMIDCELV